jgi:hypothetical protein
MSIGKASAKFAIPISSLYNHIYGITLSHKKGCKGVFSEIEAQQIVEWIQKLQTIGHPISLTGLCLKVTALDG